ncbi:hypothetical protein C8J56DRAFT_380311 [Mycena floridula]|nr:hypothetical protein C8J56DRAFT_380311 [Mycena floridula]
MLWTTSSMLWSAASTLRSTFLRRQARPPSRQHDPDSSAFPWVPMGRILASPSREPIAFRKDDSIDARHCESGYMIVQLLKRHLKPWLARIMAVDGISLWSQQLGEGVAKKAAAIYSSMLSHSQFKHFAALSPCPPDLSTMVMMSIALQPL